jgi:hypothetical protein
MHHLEQPASSARNHQLVVLLAANIQHGDDLAEPHAKHSTAQHLSGLHQTRQANQGDDRTPLQTQLVTVGHRPT